MKIAVRYASKSGRTKKLADGIASVAGIKALPVEQGLQEDVDVLFLGSSIRGTINPSVKKFVKTLNVKVGEIVSFSTSAVSESTYPQVKKLVEKYGYNISKSEFHAPGKLGLKYKDRPNQKDIEEVKIFTKKYLGLEGE